LWVLGNWALFWLKWIGKGFGASLMRNHKKKTWPLNLSLRLSKVVWVIVLIQVSRPDPIFSIGRY
jgi:uncharacterized membrane-anchored protein